MNQTSIFDMMYPKYKITKPIRLIELFGGYGSQALALKYLGVKFEHWKLCEWAIKSIQAYKDIHCENDNTDYSRDYSMQDIIGQLYFYGISSNYNEPMTLEQVKRLNETQQRKIFNNIKATHNLVNIQTTHGTDLKIVDTDKYEYIMTYSFPCQDLSLAGKGKGMSDTSTRSGLLWEVERILTECKELGTMPQILLMENVPQVHSLDNMADFHKWQVRLEELGYKNYWQDLIATDYGIPQTRNRCFMISILGEYSYTFPQTKPLKLKLKDMLEDNVDGKYYLSDKMIKYISADNQKWTGNNGEALINKTYASTLNTNEGSRRCDASNYISEDVEENYNLKNIHKTLRETLENNEIKEEISYIDAYNRKIRDDNLSSTISTRVDASNNTYIAIKNATKQGYLKATDGDGIDLAQPNSKTRRGRVQKGSIQTLTTQNNLGVVTIGNYSPSNHNASRVVDNDGLAPTVMENHGTITAIIDKNNKNAKHQQDLIQDANGIAKTLVCGTHGNGGHYTKTLMNDLRIRKLTPRECFRLMGVKDEDYEKCSKNQSDSSLYHLAGDSIVVNVLMAIFKELL